MTDDSTGGERIAKVMARAGVASRRDAERIILAGRVAVNGTVVTSPALDVKPTDKVTLDGKPIDAPQATRMWLYYKPLGLVTSEKDEKGRQTVFDTLPEGMPRVMSVGRLDLNSEGLLLLTNDGALKRRLELPETGWLRRYRVRVNGRPNDQMLAPMRDGMTVKDENGKDETFLPMDITIDKQQGANAWLTVGLREGKNREIRRAMTEVGLIVNRLIRVSYGPFRLNLMKPGDVVEVKARVLREQLGGLLTGDEGGEARPKARAAHGDAPRRPRESAAGEARGPRKPRSGTGGKPDAGSRDDADRSAPERADRRPPRADSRTGPGKPRDDAKPGARPEGWARPDRTGGPARGGKPGGKSGGKPGGDRPWQDRGEGGKGGGRSFRPRDDAAGAERPARPARAERGPSTYKGKSSGDRPRGDAAGPDRPRGDWVGKDRPAGEGPRKDRPSPTGPRADRPRGDAAGSDRPRGDWVRKDRPAGEGAGKDRPSGDGPRKGPRPAAAAGAADRPAYKPREGAGPRAARSGPGGKPGAKPQGKSWGKPAGKPAGGSRGGSGGAGGKPGGARPGKPPRDRGPKG